jgi:signal transduction histidine kinase
MRRFMADAAHELRTPVTLLRTRAEMALGEPREAGRDDATLQAIEREAERLGAVVGDLLLLARADAGERPLARETVYLDDLAAESVEAIRPLAARREVALEVGTFEETPVTGDPTLLRRLIVIVLDNAVKFTPAGGRVRLDVSSESGTGSLVVRDTGIGISAEILPHVFDRFFRGDLARRKTDGAGLGLAIAGWIADAHRARIEIGSTPGQGTRVAVVFPPVG